MCYDPSKMQLIDHLITLLFVAQAIHSRIPIALDFLDVDLHNLLVIKRFICCSWTIFGGIEES